MSQNTVAVLLKRLEIFRSNLDLLLYQAAKRGGKMYIPVELHNQITDSRFEITDIKQKLRHQGFDAPHSPDDEDTPPISSNDTKNSTTSTSDATTIHLISVKLQKFDLDPDYTLDWRHFFVGSETKRLPQIKDSADWNTHLLPQLHKLEAQINQSTRARLIKVRGLARISPYLAFGHAFSEVARYTIEVDQYGQLWRTNAPKNPDFAVAATNDSGQNRGETIDGSGTTVAVGVSVYPDIESDVRKHLAERTEPVAALLLLRPERELDNRCLQSAGDAVALADAVKQRARTFVKHWDAQRLLFFYSGPVSGACFIGHRLNAVCRQIQLMEYQVPGYAPSFLLE